MMRQLISFIFLFIVSAASAAPPNILLIMVDDMGDGRKHDHGDLPCVVAGHAGGALTGGRYLRMKDETPMANLFVTTAHLAGTKLDRFGDSTGALALG